MSTEESGSRQRASGEGDSNGAFGAYLAALRRELAAGCSPESLVPLTVATDIGPMDARQVVLSAGRLALVGAPGSGKTTLLRGVALAMAESAREAPRTAVPVYVDLASARPGESAEDLVDRTMSATAGMPAGSTPFEAKALLLDNLDRVSDVYLLEGLELLLRAGGKAGPAVAVACRQADWPALAAWFHDVPVATVRPLSPGAVRESLHRSLPEAVAADAERWLNHDAALARAVQTPLALSAFRAAVLDHPAPSWRRCAVMEALLESVLAGISATERKAYRAALADVALDSLGQGALVEVDTVAMGLGVTRDAMIRSGAVVAHGSALEFVEPLLAQHCAATRLVERAASDPRMLAERLGDVADPRRADTLVHVYSLAPAPEDFLLAVLPLPGGPELAARCLGEPHAADPEGPAGARRVAEALVGRAQTLPAATLYRLGEALVRSGHDQAAEVALLAAVDRAGDGTPLGAFARTDIDAEPPIADWVRRFLGDRNRSMALRAAKSAGEADEALASAHGALERLGADLLFEQGLAALDAGDLAAALENLDAAVRVEPDRARYCFHQGRALLSAGRAEEARTAVLRARELAPGRAAVEAAAGEACRATDRVEEALEHYAAACRLGPAEATWLEAAGELQAEAGDLAAAIGSLRLAVAACPGDAAWHDALGQVLAEAGQWPDAAQSFQEAHDLRPDVVAYERHLGRARLVAGDVPGAVAALRHAAGATAEDPTTTALLATALAAGGDLDEARDALTRAVAKDDGWPADHILLARLSAEAGDRQAMLGHARRARALAPWCAASLESLAWAEAEGPAGAAAGAPTGPRPAVLSPTGSPASLAELAPPEAAPVAGESVDAADAGDAAEEAMRLSRAVAADPENAELQHALAAALSTAGDEERALGVLQRAARLSPDSAPLQADLAAAALALGRLNEAAAAVRASLAMDPSAAATHALEGEIAAAAGDRLRAIVAYETALRRSPDTTAYAVRLAQMQAPYNAKAVLALLVATAARTGNPEVYRRLAEMQADQEQWASAAESYAQARQLGDDIDLAACHGQALRLAGRPHEAVGVLEAAWVPGRESPELLAELARAYEAVGRQADALAAYEAASAGPAPASASALVAWSRLALEAGQLDVAVESARRAAAEQPDLPEAYLALARAYGAAGSPSAAMTAYVRAGELAPDRVAVRLEQARLAMDHGLHAEAVASLEEGIADLPSSAELHFALGQVYAGRGWAAEARAEVQRAVELAPQEPRYAGELARLAEEDDPRAAIALLEQLVTADPTDADALARLGALLGRQGDQEGALARFRQAVEVAPGRADLHRVLGECLARMERPGADAALRTSLAIEPRDAATHAALGDWLARQGRVPAALDAYAAATRLAPDCAGHWRSLGRLRLSSSDAAGGAEALARAVRLDPGDAACRVSLGQALDRLGRRAEAEVAYSEAVRAAGDEPSTHMALGQARLAAGDPWGAAQAFERTVALDPADLDARSLLVEATLAGGRPEAAVAHARALTDARPDDVDPWALLARACRQAGDAAGAAAALDHALALAPDDAGLLAARGEVAVEVNDRRGALDALCRAAAALPDEPELALRFAEMVADDGWSIAHVIPRLGQAPDTESVGPALEALDGLRERAVDGRIAARAARAEAELLSRSGDVEAALAAARRALELDDSPDNQLLVARCRLAAGDVGGASAAIGFARAMGSDGAEVHALAARVYRAEGDQLSALAALEVAVERAPDVPELLAELGAAYSDLGRPEEAVQAYRRAAAASDGGYAPELARAALAAGQVDLAREALVAAAEQAPHDGTLQRALGAALRADGDLHGAAAALEQACRLDPTDARAFAELGHVRRVLGDLGAAREAYRAAAEREPDEPQHRLLLGEVALELGDTSLASDLASEVLEATPDHVGARKLVGRIALASEDLPAAQAAFEAAAASDPADAGIELGLGLAASRMGKAQLAIAHLEAAAMLDPSSVDTFLSLGEEYAKEGLVDDAIQAYQQAVVIDPQAPQAHIRLGTLCSEAGLAVKAMAHLQKALELAPVDPVAHQALGQAFLRASRASEAVDAYESAIRGGAVSADLLFDAGLAYKALHDYGRAADMFRRATQLAPGHGRAVTQLAAVTALQFLDRVTTEASHG